MKIYANRNDNILSRMCGTNNWIKVAYRNHIYLINVLDIYKDGFDRTWLKCKMVMWNQLVNPFRSDLMIYQIDTAYHIPESFIEVKYPIDMITDDEVINIIRNT